ncbi:hypothetical protein I5Q34_16055 [Streptomyces sp. AV19]|nr:hypothetical protein [Streptomyces sp. AV19]MBH1935766.1 hypothetical protein [Streptomyces sp. AV19]MDG4535960.1 hypothetical protein [Streptomyces sp. AV19]
MTRRRHRTPRPWFDWAGLGEGLIIAGGLVFACCVVVWLAVHGRPSHF